MWFTSGDSKQRTGIAYAESTDGKRWTLWKRADRSADSLADLVVMSSPNGWDAPGVENASVLRLPTGGYRMYYTGNRPPEGSNTYAIGLATSDDGIAWRKQGSSPIFEGANPWERPNCSNPRDSRTCKDGGPLEPSVIYDAKEGLYKMWYAAVGVKGFLSFRIGYATSKDGISWTRRPDPVLEPAGKGAWDETWVSHVNVIPDPQAGYHLFYFSTPLADICDGCEMQPGMIGHAYSVDGIRWIRNPKNPILSPRKGKWDAWTVGGPTALIREGKIWLWYHGFESRRGLKSAIGLVTALCGS
jgi:predicted GH43/DUF377 family glycosyl hydrolase